MGIEKKIMVAKANENKSFLMTVGEIKEWEVKSKTKMRDSYYVKTQDGVFSIKVKDYEEVFENE